MTENISFKYPLQVDWTSELPDGITCRSPNISFGGSEWGLVFSFDGSDCYYKLTLLNMKSNLPASKECCSKITTSVGDEFSSIPNVFTQETFSPKSGTIIWRKDPVEMCVIPGIFMTKKIKISCTFLSIKNDVKKTQGGVASPPCTGDCSSLKNLSRNFSTFMEDETFSDVKLKCADRTFSAHRSVLAARSEVFAAMFRNEMAEREAGSVDIKDVEPEVLQLLLQHVYSGKNPDLCEDKARRLYEAADKYAVHGLKRACSDWMVEHQREKNCLDLLVLADEHSDEHFIETVTCFIANMLCSVGRESWSTFKEEYPALAVKIYDKHFADEISKQP